MKKKDILEKLKEGNLILKSESFNFSRGKLKRGTKYRYSIQNETITVTQFENLLYSGLIIKESDKSNVLRETYYVLNK